LGGTELGVTEPLLGNHRGDVPLGDEPQARLAFLLLRL